MFITNCNDNLGTSNAFGYCLDLTRSNEWVKYTLNVLQSGYYNVEARVAGIGTQWRLPVCLFQRHLQCQHIVNMAAPDNPNDQLAGHLRERLPDQRDQRHDADVCHERDEQRGLYKLRGPVQSYFALSVLSDSGGCSTDQPRRAK